jgi:hypothetical protein
MEFPVITEAVHPFAPLIEAHNNLSFDEIIVAQNQTIVVGQVLGSAGVAADESSTVTPNAGNTGNGALTVAAINSQAIDGIYNIVMLTAGAAAEFDVTDPNGQVVGAGKVGTAFVGPINFTIAAGGTAFAIGDEIALAVERPFGEGGEQWEAWNPVAADGSQVARAIAMYPATTGAGQSAKIAALRRDGVARLADLTFATGATAAQIAEATNQLAKSNIILR